MSEFEQPVIDSTDRTDLLIWWTDQEECESIGNHTHMLKTVPEYIRKEYSSRYGRNGRGRLWTDAQFGAVGFPWDTTKPASRLADKRGGIVIWASDAAHVFGLPGFLTDQRLNIINELGEHK